MFFIDTLFLKVRLAQSLEQLLTSVADRRAINRTLKFPEKHFINLMNQPVTGLNYFYYLDFRYWSSITDNVLDLILAQHGQTVLILKLSHCHQLTEKSLGIIEEHAPRLKKLVMKDMPFTDPPLWLAFKKKLPYCDERV